MLLIRGYQLIVSPWLGPRCRFYPSCSRYAYQAVSTHGAVRGTGLAAWRVLRCNPWNPGGIDPVPPRRNAKPDPGHRHDAPAVDEHMSGAHPADAPATPGPDHTRGA